MALNVGSLRKMNAQNTYFSFLTSKKNLLYANIRQWGNNHIKLVNIRDGEIQPSVASSAVSLCLSVLYSDLKSTFSNSGDNRSSWVIVAKPPLPVGLWACASPAGSGAHKEALQESGLV